MAFIEISHISKNYGKKSVLKDISFNANPGECIGIVGANGCGKSTLLKILSGAITPNGGSILYKDKNPLAQKKYFYDSIGYIPQDNPLFDNLTVYDNLKLWYCDSPLNLEKEIKSGVIARFGIDKFLKTTVKNLSGGMKKRLSIACGVAKKPDILILDEPGASLDIVCKEEIRTYMEEYIQKGGTIIIASHEERELSACTKMYIMEEGVLNELSPDTSMDEIFGRLVKQYD